MSEIDFGKALERSLELTNTYDVADRAVKDAVANYARHVMERSGVVVELVHASSLRVREHGSSFGGLFGAAEAMKPPTYRDMTFDDDSENSATKLALIAKYENKKKLLLKIELSPAVGFPITVSGPVSYQGNTVSSIDDLNVALLEALQHPIVGRKIRSLEQTRKEAEAKQEERKKLAKGGGVPDGETP